MIGIIAVGIVSVIGTLIGITMVTVAFLAWQGDVCKATGWEWSPSRMKRWRLRLLVATLLSIAFVKCGQAWTNSSQTPHSSTYIRILCVGIYCIITYAAAFALVMLHDSVTAEGRLMSSERGKESMSARKRLAYLKREDVPTILRMLYD